MNLVKPPNLKLKKYMLEHDIKQKELADVLGITQSLFSQKINENRSTFSLEEVRVICAHLDLNMHEYFFEDNVPEIGLEKLGG
ncbi:helix-turn-helix transcriptional regulator [Macrococcoides canis]|uniref:helix-turn-helix transcriptional regulator n=1 Tax=Macrococcoides canis TaxID=1855823 RepID=UPI00165E4D3F|nr:helix-turn-helix transcriptional regulator [Macrococcus canis]QNR08269.1 helix-turn-helix domain-containing protein [Macrococcus canis]